MRCHSPANSPPVPVSLKCHRPSIAITAGSSKYPQRAASAIVTFPVSSGENSRASSVESASADGRSSIEASSPVSIPWVFAGVGPAVVVTKAAPLAIRTSANPSASAHPIPIPPTVLIRPSSCRTVSILTQLLPASSLYPEQDRDRQRERGDRRLDRDYCEWSEVQRPRQVPEVGDRLQLGVVEDHGPGGVDVRTVDRKPEE